MSSPELADLVKEVPASQVPPVPRDVPPAQVIPSLENDGNVFWASRSLALQADFRYGCSIGKFTNKDTSTKGVFDKITETIRSYIVSECQKNNMSSENFKLHLQALDCIMLLLAKEIDMKKIPNNNPESLLAILSGMITTYTEKR